LLAAPRAVRYDDAQHICPLTVAVTRVSHPEGANLSKPILPTGAALLLLLVLTLAVPAAAAPPEQRGLQIYLRRTTFDPLRDTPSIAAPLAPDLGTRLVLAQFTTAPTPDLRRAIEAAGARPLLYIPDNALVVRLGAVGAAALRDLPDLRWSGPFAPAYKLAPDLDAALADTAAGTLDLRLLAAADADIARLERDLANFGGVVVARSDGLNGVALRVRLPANALAQVLRRDDVLWAERFFTPQLLNDKARAIMGVTAARQQLSWLTGNGQIVAVTDTGLDVQSTVQADGNPDFAASRIVAAFTPAQLDPSCAADPAANTWGDRNGHGTHVAGSAVGAGARSPSGQSFAGVAPGAGLVVQAGSTGNSSFDCLAFDQTFLTQAYGAGARVQNASWGAPTGGTSYSPLYGGYTQFSSDVDDFLWQHKDHLLVVAAGNGGVDSSPRDGVIDADSIGQPATAKNVLSVGASESNRPPGASNCQVNYTNPQTLCWSAYLSSAAPISSDFISNNTAGIAAFSSRGPADDGRIKPEIVAPGTNILSDASQDPSAVYQFSYPASGYYAYDSGTSMAAPMISGLAALVRQWLAQARQVLSPSAALVKALLVNGAADLSPGQYGTGATREIPAAWPNNVEGWGRASLLDTLGLNGSEVWLADNSTGLSAAGATATYSLIVGAGQPLRLTLAWTDYPGSPQAAKALVNDLDLEVQTPTGDLLRGNGGAALPAGCADAASGADRCNNLESVAIAAPVAGLYTVRVRAAALPQASQPFALVGRAQSITDQPLATPALQPIPGGGSPAVKLSWNAVDHATFYTIERSATSDFAAIDTTYTSSQPSVGLIADVGTYWFRVRACTLGSCSPPSNARSATVTTPPIRYYAPLLSRAPG
jgi:hypothetical protein